jgi:hypothetical protein
MDRFIQELLDQDPPIIEKVFENLPIQVDLGDRGEGILGWANAFQKSDGTTTIILSLDAEASKRLGDMTELFKWYALGFAGIARGAEGKAFIREQMLRSVKKEGPDA